MDRSLESYSPWGCKESDMTEQLQALYKHYLPDNNPVSLKLL